MGNLLYDNNYFNLFEGRKEVSNGIEQVMLSYTPGYRNFSNAIYRIKDEIVDDFDQKL